MDAIESEPTLPWAITDRLDDIFDLDKLKDAPFRESLDLWRQGDLVRGARLFWGSGSGVDGLTDVNMDSSPDGGWSVARWEHPNNLGADDNSPEPIAIITSQTCDVVATGPGGRHPTVQVSPLIRLTQIGNERAEAVRNGRTVDMVLITNTPPTEEWAADLRISLPISKFVLVAQQPTRAFLTAQDECAFADRVALKIRRPAVHDATVELARSLDQLVKTSRRSGMTWIDRVEQVRARATSGTLLKPEALELLIITLDGRFLAEQKDSLRQWYFSTKKRFKLQTGGGILTPLRFVELEKMKVQDYRESVPLSIPELGQRPFW
ncbi:MAG: hypothetical protein ACYCU8_00420 [Ferrimicrobium acidiphilum]